MMNRAWHLGYIDSATKHDVCKSNQYHFPGSCEFLYPEASLDFIIHWSVSLIAPTALVFISSVFALPSAIKRHKSEATSYKQDTIILRRVANNKPFIVCSFQTRLSNARKKIVFVVATFVISVCCFLPT